MKLNFSKNTSSKVVNRMKKKIRIRKVVKGTAERPRLCIFKSSKHMYAQIINDDAQTTLVSTSTLTIDLKNGNKDHAKQIGAKIAEEAKKKGITNVVFDRNGFIYHGRVQALAEGAREGGLNF